MTHTPTQPNKPGGDIDSDGEPRDADDRRAVKNQGSVTPDDYPPGSNGKPETPPKNARP
ncbi:hypothetical protein [Sphingomonas sp. LT1P40]|uniref:hypothetical protein n=1 Tax=Alteristakelama amylovorans TaxID=3096166 RepID=UPI002FC5D7BF